MPGRGAIVVQRPVGGVRKVYQGRTCIGRVWKRGADDWAFAHRDGEDFLLAESFRVLRASIVLWLLGGYPSQKKLPGVEL